MKKRLIILAQIVFAFSAHAQNWQTVYLRDTNFYSAGNVINGHMADSDLLRTIWVDSAKSIANDSIFFFFHGIRIDTPLLTKCQDTMAPSWLGPDMIRQPDGTENYFNNRGDTIRIRTNAGLGETWILAKDMTGRIFQGTITSLFVQTIDGTPDSVKTISIQAINGGIPVADPYNALIFQLSKAHGWLKTLDLYRFPDKLNQSPYDQYGLIADPYQHQRLPKLFGSWQAGYIDLSWRYAPGGDFIIKHNYGVPNSAGTFFAPTTGGNEVVTEDSVLSFTLVSAGKAAVRFHANSFSHLWIYKPLSSPNEYADTVFTATYIHTDTISNYGGKEVRSFPLYESKDGPLPYGMPSSGSDFHYFTDSMSNGLFSFEEAWATPSAGLVKNAGCWKWSGSSPDPEAKNTNWVEDFGVRLSFYYYASPMPLTYDKTEITYASLPGLKWGKKINVLQLGVNEEIISPASFSIYPNPASGFILISSNSPLQQKQITLCNVAGQTIYQQSSLEEKIKIPIIDIPAGLYFLQISGKEGRQSFKVLVQH